MNSRYDLPVMPRVPSDALPPGVPLLLEREAERASVEDALATALDGRGTVLALEGVAGIGKTGLLEFAAARAADLGFLVGTARGDAFEQEFDHGMAVQLFEPLVAAFPGALTGQAALASPLLAASTPSRESAAHRRELDSFSIVHGLFWLASNLAEGQPLLLLLDDLHWSDTASLRAVRYLARRIASLPVVLVLAARSGEPGADSDELEAIRADPSTVVLRPSELTPSGVASFVHDAFRDGPVPDDGFIEACARSTGGNPFLLHELVRQLRFEGVEPTVENAALLDGLHGDTVRRSVLLRLSRMGPDAVRVAAAFAVLGRDGTVSRAGVLAGIGEEAARRLTDELVAVDILRGDAGALRYAHPLIRAAIYGDLSAERRASLHAEAAQALLQDRAPSTNVASHLVHAPPAGSAQVVEVLVEAAHRAQDRRASRSAASYLRRAVAEPPSPEQLPELLLELARASFAAGLPGAIEDAEAAVGAARSPAGRAAALTALGEALHAAGRHHDAAAAYQQALDLIPSDGDEGQRNQLQARWILVASLDRTLAPEATERARAAVDSPPDLDTAADRALFATLCAQEARAGGSAEWMLMLARRSLAGGKLVEEQGAGSSIPYLAINALNWGEDWSACHRATEMAFDDARTSGSVHGFAAASQARALLAWRVGDVANAAVHATAALNAGEDGWHAYAPLNAWILVRAAIERSELDVAAATVAALDDEHWSTSVLYPYVLSARAFVRRAEGATEDALALQLAAGRVAAAFATNPAILSWRSDAAWLAMALGDAVRAEALAREELADAERFGAPRAIGVARVALGAALADEGEGLEMVRRGIGELRTSGAKLVLAEAILLLGTRLRRGRRRGAARAPLRDALALAHECGSRRLEQLAREELAATGARPRRSALHGTDSLTPSELRICRMAAEGQTNRQIAEALFVTPKAVEFHLSNAYRKLGIQSRRALATTLSVS